jgi:PAS domain S-box-containing protein
MSVPSSPKPHNSATEYARLAALVESSWDAILSVDLDGILTSFNPAAEALYDYAAEEVLAARWRC